MNRFINSLKIGLVAAFVMFAFKPVDAQPRVGVNINFQTFYDELSPYGDWIDYPEYGYTWRPRLGSDFRPYSTNGNWVYADESWMWNSGYDWGWAPFHYGRWFQDPYYGWMWVPGYDWSPAWVSWRGGGDYYGWAPIRPGISISIGFGNYNPPYDYWTFAPSRYMNSPYISRYYHPFRNNVTIFNRTTIINNYYGNNRGGSRGGYYTNGPRRTDVERYTGRIRSVAVRTSDRPGRTTVSRNAVSVYRPNVSRSENRSSYTPRNVQSYERSNVANNRGNTRSSRDLDSRNNSNNNFSRNDRTSQPSRNQEAIRNNDRVGREANNNGSSSRRIETRNETVNRATVDRNNTTAERNSQMNRESMQRQQQERSSIDRSAEMRQRNVEAQQRSQQMRQQREAQVQQQNRSREAAQQQQRSIQAQREVQTRERSREMQVQRQSSTPQVERSAPSRSMESRSSSGSSRSMNSGGDRSSRSAGGERSGRGR